MINNNEYTWLCLECGQRNKDKFYEDFEINIPFIMEKEVVCKKCHRKSIIEIKAMINCWR